GFTNGAFPIAGLTWGNDGYFYGVTTRGGLDDRGTVFRISPNGVYTNLYSFTGGDDGGNPRGELFLAADGNFYGTTTDGGAYGLGTVLMMAPDGAPAALVQFDGFNGANPQAAFVQDDNGYLYGATQNGGPSDSGVMYRLTIDSAPFITSQPADQSVFAGT